jgi:hypothetical protein
MLYGVTSVIPEFWSTANNWSMHPRLLLEAMRLGEIGAARIGDGRDADLTLLCRCADVCTNLFDAASNRGAAMPLRHLVCAGGLVALPGLQRAGRRFVRTLGEADHYRGAHNAAW